MRNFARHVIEWCSLPGRLAGWLILPLIVFVCAAVLAAKLGVNSIVGWKNELPVVGSALTVNSLLDLQWYIFAVIVLFGGVYAFRDDHHVNVDFLSSAFSPRVKKLVQIFGDLFFLLPFCAVIAWYGSKFAYTAFLSGEGSTYGGLLDRWIIKACLPLSFVLLGICAVARALSSIASLVAGDDDPADGSNENE